MMNNGVECGNCVSFSRTEAGTGRCAIGGEASRRWPWLTFPNFPMPCKDYREKPIEPEPQPGQQALDLEDV